LDVLNPKKKKTNVDDENEAIAKAYLNEKTITVRSNGLSILYLFE